MDKDFYYNIKGKAQSDGYGTWIFPPIFCGKVTAINRAAAKALIEEEYGREFPTRVLRDDLEKQPYLLKISEIKEEDEYTRELFELRECEVCGKGFKVVDKYNDVHCKYKGRRTCSDDCYAFERSLNALRVGESISVMGKNKPVIYRIHNRVTGMSYVGKTTQIFTLRWYQHFYQSTNTKFHQAIKKTPIVDWVFSVEEVVDVPLKLEQFEDDNEKECLSSLETLLSEREKHWIGFYDSIQNGYNSSNG